jgi:hypothetical protein
MMEYLSRKRYSKEITQIGEPYVFVCCEDERYAKKGVNMKRQKQVGLVSAMGTGFEIVNRLVTEVQSQGGDENDVRQLLSSKELLATVAKTLVGKTEVVMKFGVVVDYNLRLDQRLENYGLYCSSIIQNYSIVSRSSEAQVVKMVVVRFGRHKHIPQMNEELKALDLQHTDIEDLIAFGAQCPEWVCRLQHIHCCKGVRTDAGGMSLFEIPVLHWAIPGDLSISTNQFFFGPYPGACILCREA